VQEPSLIALHGARGAGKDTTFDFIQKWCAKSDPALSAVRRGFADYMKWAYMRMWVPGCTMEWAIDFIDQWKNDPDATCIGVSVELMEDQAWAKSQVFIPGVNFRDHMNQFATESAREIYGDDHWVDILLPKEPTNNNPEGWRGHFLVPPRSEADFPYSFAHFAVITDLRADNEMERVAQLGGLRVKIKRRDAEEKQRRYYEERGEDPHLFARELPDDQFDVIINNDDNNMESAYIRTAHLMHEINYNGIASIKRGVPIPWRI
jgi:hypothetical protein